MDQTMKNNEQNNIISNDVKPKKVFVILAKPPNKVIRNSDISTSPSIHSFRSPNKIQKTITSGKTRIPITVYIAPSTSKGTDSGTSAVQIVSDVQHYPNITEGDEASEMDIDNFQNTRVLENSDTSKKTHELLQDPNEKRKSSVSQISRNLPTGTTSKSNKLVKWNRNACLLLAETYKIYENEFNATHTRKKRVWEKISRILNEKYGLGVNPSQCENKMRSILYSHQRVADNKKSIETKAIKQFSLQNFEELQTVENFVDNHPTNVISECISLDTPENKTSFNTFEEKLAEYRNMKLIRRDKIRRDKEVRTLIDDVTKGMERRHKEKMAKCDKMIEILGKIVDKF